jgi:hypothetical protein
MRIRSVIAAALIVLTATPAVEYYRITRDHGGLV